LNDKIKEAETMRSNKFKDIVLQERKKYAAFLAMWIQVLQKDLDMHNEGIKGILLVSEEGEAVSILMNCFCRIQST
jgi:hypothetical protein